jgi:hypothetical protein
MQRALVLLVAAAALLAACGPRAPSPASQAVVTPASVAVTQVSCDDGGDGGVVLHGVCL